MRKAPQDNLRRGALLLGALLLLCGLIGALFGLRPGSAVAAPLAAAPSMDPAFALAAPAAAIRPTAADLACLLCHAETDNSIGFPSGESKAVQVDHAEIAASVHGMGDEPLACTSCHEPTAYQYPHRPVEAATLRDYNVSRSQACSQCHVQPHITSHPGLDTPEPVVCTDCHGAHDVAPAAAWSDPTLAVTCVDCHREAGVAVQDRDTLATVIANGLFAQRPDSDYCLSCHTIPFQQLEFANGDTVSIVISRQALHDSVHGDSNTWDALQCTDCHNDYGYPHAPVEVETYREYSLVKYPVCATCHEPKYDQAQDSVHALALADGNLEAAVCTDCHGAHNTPVPNVPRQRISQTCRQCHATIYDEYAESVHGTALLQESNVDVPTCIECHGVHNISDPTTNLFRIRSPELCASCHADDALMAKYDISTAVFDTYVADFHGTTVTLFEHQDPNVETNKAVCYDCHGVHNIKDPNDPEAGIKANLLETCRQCHPDASENFPDSWTSHFEPSLQNNTLVYLINLFYKLVIPGTVGFFGFLVATDVFRRVRVRVRGNGKKEETR